MADYSYDISNRNKSVYSDDYDAYINHHLEEEKLKALYEDKGTLSFEDMLQLMVAQFQNQTMDDQASTTDMMNQLVSMSTMQAMNQMVESMGEIQLANVMSYAASLVEKEVTVFDGWDENGMMIERTGIVTGMGTYGGQQVIFIGEEGDMYYLSDILAVGKLPPKKETEIDSGDDEEEDDSQVGGAGSVGGSDNNKDDDDKDKEITHVEGCNDPNCKGECVEKEKDDE